MYIKLHKIVMDKTLTKSTKFDHHGIKKHTLQYKLLQHNKTQTYLITVQPF